MADDVRIRVGLNLALAQSELKKFKTQIQGTQVDFNSKGVDKTTTSLKKMGTETKNVATQIGSAAAKMSLWLALGSGLTGFVSGLRSMGETIFETDQQLTNIAFTTGFTNEQFGDLVDSSEALAQSLGGVSSEILEISKTYANLNETLESVIINTKSAQILKNLGGDQISVQQAISSIQGLQQQFGLLDEDASKIVDTLTFVSANLKFDFAEGIKEISNGISISGRLASEAGLEYEKFIALLGLTVAETRRSGSSISSGKTNKLTKLFTIPYVIKVA